MLELLKSSGKQIFHVKFIKRSTGELRSMNARLGVKKHLKGGPQPYNPADHNLLFVFDMDKKQYRSIPLENVTEVRINGEIYKNTATNQN